MVAPRRVSVWALEHRGVIQLSFLLPSLLPALKEAVLEL